ncbi:MAG: FAD-dependent oxidoreductase [Clostridia bacterium]|nr:FAD-dependent oxidoreductase [Clostridia bacterium]
MKSLWLDSLQLPAFPPLEHDLDTEVVIIGGGLAGILTAYMLQQQGIDYALVEADKICRGISGNTTAKITSQHSLIYDRLLHEQGSERALMYYRANEQALAKYRELAASYDCDFESKSAFVYTLDQPQKIEREAAALTTLGCPFKMHEQLPLPFAVAAALEFTDQAQFNPVKLVAAIAADLRIYEQSMVREISPHQVIAGEHKIKTRQIIVTTHFPFINKHGAYFLKMYQHRSYVIALENAPAVGAMYVDEAEKGMSFRDYGDLLLLGGGDHRTGKEGGNWCELRDFAARFYPKAWERYAWAAQDCMSLDQVPYIGRYGSSTPDLYVATGFNKWGMTSSMVAAQILSDLVAGRQPQFAEVFDPQRSMLKPRLLVNGFTALINLLTISNKRCPHLGCALSWNDVEQSWDCPCHGSRFTKEGELLDNPATGPAKVE